MTHACRFPVVFEHYTPPPAPPPPKPNEWWVLEVLNPPKLGGNWNLHALPTQERARQMRDFYEKEGRTVGRLFCVTLAPHTEAAT